MFWGLERSSVSFGGLIPQTPMSSLAAGYRGTFSLWTYLLAADSTSVSGTETCLASDGRAGVTSCQTDATKFTLQSDTQTNKQQRLLPCPRSYLAYAMLISTFYYYYDYPKPPHFDILYRFYIFIVSGDRDFIFGR